MNITIHPGLLRGEARVPVSKSMAHRALIAAALADAPTELLLGDVLNDDIEATVACLTALGAEIGRGAGVLNVRPIKNPYPDAALDCGESGSTLRFMLPVACALGVKTRLTGRGRLPERPNRPLCDALRAHGAAIDADALPMCAAGPLTGGLWTLPGNVSSQYVTGLLLALPLLREDSEIVLTTSLESAAYVDMTRAALRDFGIATEPTPNGWRVRGGQVYRSPGRFEVEGDWSAAAFWHAANAMGSAVTVSGVSGDSAQGDRAVLDLLGQSTIDARHVPDLVPALAAAAAALPRRTTITGAARLRLKESDRLQTTAAMIAALGGHAEVTDDGLVIEGGRPLRSGTVDGAGDHRIVMAAAILATRAAGPVTVVGAEAVSKSYPNFFEHFRALGGIADVEYTG